MSAQKADEKTAVSIPPEDDDASDDSSSSDDGVTLLPPEIDSSSESDDSDDDGGDDEDIPSRHAIRNDTVAAKRPPTGPRSFPGVPVRQSSLRRAAVRPSGPPPSGGRGRGAQRTPTPQVPPRYGGQPPPAGSALPSTARPTPPRKMMERGPRRAQTMPGGATAGGLVSKFPVPQQQPPAEAFPTRAMKVQTDMAFEQLSDFEKFEQYVRSEIPVRRLVYVRRLVDTAKRIGAEATMANIIPLLKPMCEDLQGAIRQVACAGIADLAKYLIEEDAKEFPKAEALSPASSSSSLSTASTTSTASDTSSSTSSSSSSSSASTTPTPKKLSVTVSVVKPKVNGRSSKPPSRSTSPAPPSPYGAASSSSNPSPALSTRAPPPRKALPSPGVSPRGVRPNAKRSQRGKMPPPKTPYGTQGLAKALPALPKSPVKTNGKKATHGAAYMAVVKRVLPIMPPMLVDSVPEVRTAAQEAVVSMSKLLDADDVAEYVLPLVLSFAHDNKDEQKRTAAVPLINLLAPILGLEICRSFLVHEIAAMAEDPSFNVRRAAAQTIGNMCSLIGSDFAESKLLPVYLKLCKDHIWSIRKACVESLVQVSGSVTPKTRSDELQPLWERFSKDVSRWVRNLAFEKMGPFIHTFTSEQLSEDFIKQFTGIPKLHHTIVDSDVVYHCAFNFSAVVLTLGPERWEELRATYALLAKDTKFKIRRTLAYSLHEIARILGSKLTEAHLVSVFEVFLVDLDEVREGVVKSACTFLSVLSPDVRKKYLNTLWDLLTEKDTNWRFRLYLTEQLRELCDLYSHDVLVSTIAPLALNLCDDRLTDIRKTAIKYLACYVVRLNKEIADADGDAKPLREKALAGFCHRLFLFAQHKNYQRRQVFVDICRYLLYPPPFSTSDASETSAPGKANSSPTPTQALALTSAASDTTTPKSEAKEAVPVPFEQFADLFLARLLVLARDPVSNVRLTLARLIFDHLKNDKRFASVSVNPAPPVSVTDISLPRQTSSRTSTNGTPMEDDDEEGDASASASPTSLSVARAIEILKKDDNRDVRAYFSTPAELAAFDRAKREAREQQVDDDLAYILGDGDTSSPRAASSPTSSRPSSSLPLATQKKAHEASSSSSLRSIMPPDSGVELAKRSPSPKGETPKPKAPEKDAASAAEVKADGDDDDEPMPQASDESTSSPDSQATAASRASPSSPSDTAADSTPTKPSAAAATNSTLTPPAAASSRAHARSPSSAKIQEIMAKTPEGGKQNAFPAPKKGQSSNNDIKDIAGKIQVKPRTLKRSEIRRRPRPASTSKSGTQTMSTTETAASSSASDGKVAATADVTPTTQGAEDAAKVVDATPPAATPTSDESKSPAAKPAAAAAVVVNAKPATPSPATSSNGTGDVSPLPTGSSPTSDAKTASPVTSPTMGPMSPPRSQPMKRRSPSFGSASRFKTRSPAPPNPYQVPGSSLESRKDNPRLDLSGAKSRSPDFRGRSGAGGGSGRGGLSRGRADHKRSLSTPIAHLLPQALTGFSKHVSPRESSASSLVPRVALDEHKSKSPKPKRLERPAAASASSKNLSRSLQSSSFSLSRPGELTKLTPEYRAARLAELGSPPKKQKSSAGSDDRVAMTDSD